MRNNDLIDGYLDGMSEGTNWTKNSWSRLN